VTTFTAEHPRASTDPGDPDLRTPHWRASTPFGEVVQITGQRPLRNVVVGDGVPRVQLVTGAGAFPSPGVLALESTFTFPMDLDVAGEPGTVDRPHGGAVPLLLTRRSRTIRVRLGEAEWLVRAGGRAAAAVTRGDSVVLEMSGRRLDRYRLDPAATPADLAVPLALTPVLGTLFPSLFLV